MLKALQGLERLGFMQIGVYFNTPIPDTCRPESRSDLQAVVLVDVRAEIDTPHSFFVVFKHSMA